eukprot:759457-Hanusia_phi.AAC.3
MALHRVTVCQHHATDSHKDHGWLDYEGSGRPDATSSNEIEHFMVLGGSLDRRRDSRRPIAAHTGMQSRPVAQILVKSPPTFILVHLGFNTCSKRKAAVCQAPVKTPAQWRTMQKKRWRSGYEAYDDQILSLYLSTGRTWESVRGQSIGSPRQGVGYCLRWCYPNMMRTGHAPGVRGESHSCDSDLAHCCRIGRSMDLK